MRHLPALSAVLAALGLIAASAAPAAAFTNTSPAGLRAGTQGLDAIEPVHCRRYLHRHGHSRIVSRGCGRHVVIESRPGVVVRDRTVIRSRSGGGTSTTIRSGDTGARTGTSTTIRSGSGAAPATGTSTTTGAGTSKGGASTKGGGEVKGGADVKGGASTGTQSAPAATQSAPSTQSAPKQ